MATVQICRGETDCDADIAVHPARSGNDYNVGTLAEGTAAIDVAVPAGWTMTEGGVLIPGTFTTGDSASLTESGSKTTGGDTADPTRLPAATGQSKSGTYGRSLSAGQNYTDPLTDVSVIKLTDSTTPFANSRAYVHTTQVTGVSLPWGTNEVMRTVAFMSTGGAGPTNRPFLCDVNTSTLAVSNYRNMSTPWTPASRCEGAVAFSNVDANIVYVVNTGDIRKWSVSAEDWVTGGGFPKASGYSRAYALHISRDDNVFVVTEYDGAPRTNFAFWTVNTDTLVDMGVAGQGGVTPDGAWGFYRGDSDGNSGWNYVCDTDDGDIYQPSPIFRSTHPAAVGHFVISSDPTTSGGNTLHILDCTDRSTTKFGSGGDYVGGSNHMFGNWKVNPDPQTVWGALSTETSSGVWDHAVGYFRMDSGNVDPRLLCHTDAIGDDFYTGQPHAQSSPDGKVVVFTSNMNTDPGRGDVFLALVPTA
jgi:hypothetical protein